MDELFYARIDDLRARADRGEIAVSGFMNESESAEAERYLRSYGEKRMLLYGGYPAAERRRLFIFPDWQEPSSEAADEFIVPLLISGSGYVKLDHRAFLGSLIALGLTRSVIGDIVVDNGSGAVVFFEEKIARYLLSSPDALSRVGRDKVKVARYKLPYGFGREQSFVGINETVSSLRLDCVVSALVSVSREKAKAMVTEGLVQVDHAETRSPDLTVSEGCVISVRGSGKYKIDSIGGRTKKDRIRLLALKYI